MLQVFYTYLVDYKSTFLIKTVKVKNCICNDTIHIFTEKALNALTIQAFIKCDVDGQMGLSWGEIEKCEEEFCPMLSVPCPNQEDFNAYDENGDGNLTVEEYFNHVNNH